MSTEKKLHLAIIPDGNRRWARSRILQPWKGHEESAKNFEKILTWIQTDGRIGTLTIWCFSTENWKRDPSEVEHLMKIFSAYLQKETPAMKKNNIRVLHSGRKDRLTPELRTLIADAEKETASCDGYTLHLALDYGGKDEVTRAVSRLQPGEIVTEESIRSHLDHPELPDIDLIVRTSGEQRTSNFFLWQSAYAEWMFLEKHFPDVTEKDVSDAVDAFTSRKRRFGS